MIDILVNNFEHNNTLFNMGYKKALKSMTYSAIHLMYIYINSAVLTE